MGEVLISFPDGSSKSYLGGISAADILRDVLGSKAKAVLAARAGGCLVDLSCRLESDTELEPVFADSADGEEILRHSTAHIMAQAVAELYPGVKLAIGPAIENGFYYDFDREEPFTEDDLGRINDRMREIIRRGLPFYRKEISKDDASRLFKEKGEFYKLELIEGVADGLSIYQQGDFLDLCRGPHIPATNFVRAFKLLSVAGAYWRGNEQNKMLRRIYGTAFATKDRLKSYLKFLEEAKRRDHRKLGRELDLFSIQEEAGAGFVLYHPKGAILRDIIEDFEKKEHRRRGYQPVAGPHLLRLNLWEKSGHYEHYRENMYFTEIEGQKYGIKPMNCLAHILIYKFKLRSYRELPIRYFELGTVYRHEKSGVLHGLFRVRGFTQDDAHIFCTPEQLLSEITGVLDFVIEVMGIFGFEYQLELSTQPEHYIGTSLDWERATNALRRAMEEKQLPYAVHEGDGAFYGPKIDVKLKDALGRLWQCATVQCDFALPTRFGLSYIGGDGKPHPPVMLHRVILGALERFIGIITEHYAGAFPVWLAPEQVRVMSITDAGKDYAAEVTQKLVEEELRVEHDLSGGKIGAKIRQAELQKVPYMIIIGHQEVAAGEVAVRQRKIGDLGRMSLNDFLAKIKVEIAAKQNPVTGHVGFNITGD